MKRVPVRLLFAALAGSAAMPACGLERDYAAYLALPATEPGNDETSSTGASTGSETSDGSTAELASSSASGTDTGEAASAGATATGTGESGAETDTTGAAPAVCGDGVVEGDEECDDPGQTACFGCAWDRLVFVTSTANHKGDFSLSPKSLDYHCNHLAAVAGLLTNNQSRFKAWVSTTEQSAAQRLAHYPGRYVLRNGLVFADSWDALVAGELLNPLNVDENSQTRNVAVWTDTRPDGTAMPGNHCEDWTSDSWEILAYLGDSTAMDSNWTLSTGEATNPIGCIFGAALYCFESL